MLDLARRRPALLALAGLGVVLLLLAGGYLLRYRSPATPASTDIAGSLRAAALGNRIQTVTINGGVVTVEFAVAEGPHAEETRRNTRIQVCNYLLALQHVTAAYNEVVLRGSDQGAAVVTLHYPAAVVAHNDWGGSEVIDTVYTLASSQEIAPAFQEP
jgi:hypothetical protein